MDEKIYELTGGHIPETLREKAFFEAGYILSRRDFFYPLLEALMAEGITSEKINKVVEGILAKAREQAQRTQALVKERLTHESGEPKN